MYQEATALKIGIITEALVADELPVLCVEEGDVFVVEIADDAWLILVDLAVIFELTCLEYGPCVLYHSHVNFVVLAA